MYLCFYELKPNWTKIDIICNTVQSMPAWSLETTDNDKYTEFRPLSYFARRLVQLPSVFLQ